MKQKPSIIFDLDGTLIDVRLRHWTVYKTIAERLGETPLAIEAYWQKKREHQPIHTIISHPSFLSQFITAIEQPQYLTLDTVFPYTISVLEQLRPTFHLHLVTVRQDATALADQLQALQLTSYFDTILTRKPDHDPAQTKISLINENHLTPIAIIGDTQADIGAAQGLSVTSIAVCSGMRTKEFLQTFHPTHIVPNIRSVPPLLIA